MKKIKKTIFVIPIGITFVFFLLYTLCFSHYEIFTSIVKAKEVMASLTTVSSSTLLDSDYGWSFKFISGTTTVTYGGMTNNSADCLLTASYDLCTNFVTSRLTSNSQKGNIWIRYNNVGTYNGKIIDVKITLVDWDYLQPANTSADSSIGGVNYPTIFWGTTSINVQITATPVVSNPTYTYTFYEHGTDTTISLKGHFTFQDMDGSSSGGNEFFIPLSNLTAYYVTSDTDISISSSKIINSSADGTANTDTNGWVTCFFSGSTFKFSYSRLKDEVGNSYRTITSTASSTSRTVYQFLTSANSVAPFEFDDLTKSSSQTSIAEGDTFTYTLNQYIPGEASTYYYTSWVLTDTIPSCFEIESVVVTDDSTTRTSWFTITTDDNVVTIKANSSTLTNSNFYNNNINIAITVTLKEGCDLSSYYSGGTFAIPNTARVTISSPTISSTRTETITSNTVNEKVYYDVTTSVNGSGGTITGDESVYYGDDSTENYIVITSDEGYLIETVTINGETTNIGYASNLVLDNFEFMTEDKEVVVTFALIPAQLLVKNIDIDIGEYLGGYSVEKYYWDTYETYSRFESMDWYEYVKVEGETSGVMQGDVTVIYYYRLKEGTVTTHYLEEGTDEELATDDVQTVKYTYDYETTSSDDVPENYELVSKTSNYKGTLYSDSIDVYYYYRVMDSTLSSTIEKEGTDEINSVDSSVTYTITYNAKISDYIGKGYVVIKDTLPYKIDETTSDLNGGTYDDVTQTITWEYELETTSIEEYEYNKTIEITLYYLDIDPTRRSMNNNVSSTITLDNNSDTIETNCVTNVLVSGNIIIHYIDKDTDTSLIDDLEVSGLVGETYTSESVEITGYNLVEEPTETTITYEDGDIEITYYYEKIKYNITTSVNGSGGTITGDESVYYGDDSTENYIVITADEGYYIKSVTINGEAIEIESELTTLTLDVFEYVTEDFNIEVEFEEEVIVVEVPDTGTNDNPYILSGVGIAIIVILCIVLSKTKKK